MQALSHALSVSSAAIPSVAGLPSLEPVRLSGREGINSLFEYELLLKTPDALNFSASQAADFNLDDFIGREISCVIQLDGSGTFIPGAVGASTDAIGAGTRQINALITAAALWGEEGRNVQYKLTLRPWLHLATLTTDCKIFQNKTVIDILDELLADYPFPVEKRLFETYPSRDYQTQLNESDFAFVERLCQEWGLSYHFEHVEGKHRLVLSDAMGAYQPNPSKAYQQVDYYPPGWKTDAEYIHSFVPASRITSGRYTTTEYDYARPRADLSQSRSDPRPTGHAGGEVYQWHASQSGSIGTHFSQPRAGTASGNDAQAEGRLLALLRMQALRTDGERATAKGEDIVWVGSDFVLGEFPWQYIRTFMEEGMDAVPAPREDEWLRKGFSSPGELMRENSTDSILLSAMQFMLWPVRSLAERLCTWPTFPEEWNSDCGQKRREDGIGPEEPLRWEAR